MISLRTPAADASIGVADVAGFIFGVAACAQADAATEKWKRLMLMRMSGLNRKAMPYATLPHGPAVLCASVRCRLVGSSACTDSVGALR